MLFRAFAAFITYASVFGAGIVLATQERLQFPSILGTSRTATSSVLRTSSDAILSQEFLEFVHELRNNASIPGVSLGVVRLNGNKRPLAQVAAWGRKTEDGDGHDLTTDTLFCLASCSKAFLATSVGLLMDDYAHGRNVTPLPRGVSRLDWDTKVSAILPGDWELDDEWSTQRASVRDIFGHVSGLPRHDYSYHPGQSPKDLINRMRDLRTAYELREKWSYNNQMYILGAHVIEHFANTTYADFISRRLFKSLGMSTSTIVPSEALASRKVTDTWTKDGRRIPFWFTDESAYLGAGAGGVISSAEDMIKWLAVLLNEGADPRSGETVLPRSVYDAVTTARHVVLGQPSPPYGSGIVGYGMGWMQWTYKDVPIVSHTGGIPGFSTMTAFSKSRNVGMVILINADEKADYAMTILKRAIDDVLELPGSPDGLESSESESKGERSKLDDGLETRTALKPPSLDLEAYEGAYDDPGYGAITICAPKSKSRACTAVLDDFASLGPLTDTTPHLYGSFRTLWSSHVRFIHHSGDTFNVTFTQIFPQGYGRNTSAFETYESGEGEGHVVFTVAAEGPEILGFALVVDQDAVAARMRRSKGASLGEAADALFFRIH
ncbi:hypothetical protein BN946_scf184836.g17 [Trametes cinnabarina]|uniref:Beta-lactamase-related domain-containing protein n=1 Tax=Pycnoporus cinnabarinus TaxID=5643 RepID=A0A060SC24_PYCCI|nr:hypothetical protein BN946_scf184836.g17 [Trametes cinnabarina]